MGRAVAYGKVFVLTGLAALGAALTPAGCVLFVPDESFGTTCHFAGAGAPCGDCVAAHCQTRVNECCADRSCATSLAALERCTTGGASGCADLVAGGGALASCVQSTCGDACAIAFVPDSSVPGSDGGSRDGAPGADGAPASDGSTPASDGSTPGSDGSTPGSDGGPATYTTSCSKLGTAACTCNAPDPAHPAAANSQACNATVVAGSLCCADSSWPSTGSTCSCMTATCSHPGGGGCDCSLGTDGQSCNDGVVCCVTAQQECLCTYGVTTCWDGTRTVSQCDAPAIGCGPLNQVTSCSLAP